MVKRLSSLLLVVLCALAPAAEAAVGVKDKDGTILNDATYVRGGVVVDGDTAVLGQETCVSFDPSEFLAVGSSTIVRPSTNTTPRIVYVNKMAALSWSPPESHPVQKTFTVPANYYSGGHFTVTVGRSGVTGTPPKLDFQVYVNASLTAFDAAATDQTAVAVSANVGSGSPEQKTLSVATDFDSLAAGQTVTWELWSSAVGTEKLYVYGGEFCYVTAAQE